MLTAGPPRGSIEVMTARVASILLAVVMVMAGSSASFAHLHPHGEDHGAERSRSIQDHSSSAHEHGQRSHWHPLNSRTAGHPSTMVSGQHHHHPSISLVTVAVERPMVRVGLTGAVATLWEAGIGLDHRSRPVPVASNAQPNPPPPTLLAARAPPLPFVTRTILIRS